MSSNGTLHFRLAGESDVDLYYEWANDILVRQNSFNQNPVTYENHVKWFHSKLTSKECFFYLFMNGENRPVGQVRIDKKGDEVIIGVSIDEAFRGKSLGVEMIEKSSLDYLQKHPFETLVAYIKVENTASNTIFKKAGFIDEEVVVEQGYKSYKLHKKLK